MEFFPLLLFLECFVGGAKTCDKPMMTSESSEAESKSVGEVARRGEK